MSNWEEEELKSINLGDKRLNERAKQILQRCFDAPTSSINATLRGWHEVKAAYRFFDNKNITAKKILSPHAKATISRIADHDIVLCIQDTTIIDYSHRKQRVLGLGKLRKEHQQGFLLHPTPAFTTDGLCLGMLHYKTWVREELKWNKLTQTAKARPIEDKESMRWIDSYRLTEAIAKNYQDKLFINIADREGDLYELLQEYDRSTSSAHLIVRAKSDRLLGWDKKSNEGKLWDKTKQQKAICVIEFKMSAIEGVRASRAVKQTVRACRVKFAPPRKIVKHNNLRPIEVTAVLCTEEQPPEGEKPIEWLLLTSLEIKETITALDIVKYYGQRWQIEIYFKTLKSGCNIEELQLESLCRLENCIAIYTIIAWRILFLTQVGRLCPELSCELFYDKSEWKAIYIIAYKKPPPKDPPAIYDMNRIIATFGGFINRKSDKEPGIKTMWIGLQRLKDFTLAFEAFFAATDNCG